MQAPEFFDLKGVEKQASGVIQGVRVKAQHASICEHFKAHNAGSAGAVFQHPAKDFSRRVVCNSAQEPRKWHARMLRALDRGELRIGRFQKFDAASIKGDANASFSKSIRQTTPSGRLGITDESVDNKGVSAVRSDRADKWLVLARNLL
ncbi:MAG: hypothetical protein MZV70_40365 [Desulfobacterales bacterium]|nr:hypothetical protein [Desulfobacterales bacterium]